MKYKWLKKNSPLARMLLSESQTPAMLEVLLECERHKIKMEDRIFLPEFQERMKNASFMTDALLRIRKQVIDDLGESHYTVISFHIRQRFEDAIKKNSDENPFNLALELAEKNRQRADAMKASKKVKAAAGVIPLCVALDYVLHEMGLLKYTKNGEPIP